MVTILKRYYMKIIQKATLFLCFICSILFIGTGFNAHAEEDLTQIRRQLNAIHKKTTAKGKTLGPIERTLRKDGTNFAGRWYGTYVLLTSTCPMQGRLNFAHLIGMRGNQVAISTSHDGILYGTSRDRGRRLEAGRSYRTRDGVNIAIAIIYGNMQGRTARTLLGAIGEKNGRTCEAYYVSYARR